MAMITDGIDETVSILETLVDGYSNRNNLPEPLRSAAAQTRGELLALIDDCRQKQLSMEDIEKRLDELAERQNLSIVVSIPEEDRAAMVEAISREYQNRTLSQDSRAKILTKKLYQKFGLPELTLFEI